MDVIMMEIITSLTPFRRIEGKSNARYSRTSAAEIGEA